MTEPIKLNLVAGKPSTEALSESLERIVKLSINAAAAVNIAAGAPIGLTKEACLTAAQCFLVDVMKELERASDLNDALTPINFEAKPEGRA